MYEASIYWCIRRRASHADVIPRHFACINLCVLTLLCFSYLDMCPHTTIWLIPQCMCPHTTICRMPIQPIRHTSRVSRTRTVCIRQHTSAYVSIRQHTSAYVSVGSGCLAAPQAHPMHRMRIGASHRCMHTSALEPRIRIPYTHTQANTEAYTHTHTYMLIYICAYNRQTNTAEARGIRG